MRSVLLVGGAVASLSVRVGSSGCIARVQWGVVVVDLLLVGTRRRGRVLPGFVSPIVVHRSRTLLISSGSSICCFRSRSSVGRGGGYYSEIGTISRCNRRGIGPIQSLVLGSYCLMQGSVSSYDLRYRAGAAGIFAPFFDRDQDYRLH